jgi:hypothetical protein
MRQIAFFLVLLIVPVVGFVCGSLIGPASWHIYCVKYYCGLAPLGWSVTTQEWSAQIMIEDNGEAAVTVKSNGQVYFGRRYNRTREAKLLADAAKQLLQDQPWPSCQDAHYSFPPNGVIEKNFGTANPNPTITKQAT